MSPAAEKVQLSWFELTDTSASAHLPLVHMVAVRDAIHAVDDHSVDGASSLRPRTAADMSAIDLSFARFGP